MLSYLYFVVSFADYQVVAGPYRSFEACWRAKARIETAMPMPVAPPSVPYRRR